MPNVQEKSIIACGYASDDYIRGMFVTRGEIIACRDNVNIDSMYYPPFALIEKSPFPCVDFHRSLSLYVFYSMKGDASGYTEMSNDGRLGAIQMDNPNLLRV